MDLLSTLANHLDIVSTVVAVNYDGHEPEWTQEEDHYSFLIKGYPCEIIRNYRGILIGQISIAQDSAFYNMENLDKIINVYGGFTMDSFSKSVDGMSMQRILRFDCDHFGDLSPIDARRADYLGRNSQKIINSVTKNSQKYIYKNVNFVYNELVQVVIQMEQLK